MLAQDFFQRIFRPAILGLSAYKVADASNLIKLDAMENPYHWPDSVIDDWLATLRNCELNRYPDPQAKQLASIIRSTNSIPETSEILLGNGSDEIIQLLLLALPQNSVVLAPEPGFVMYKQVAVSLELNYVGIPLLPESFELDLSKMLEVIRTQQPNLIFLAYPNNPTGNLFDTDAITAIIKAAPGLVIIDEAYAPFADSSFMSVVADFPNVLVMRTVSKLGLAGLRLGYIVGHAPVINELNKLRLPYNINILTQVSAHFALSHPEIFTQQILSIREERSRMLAALNSLEGIIAYPSSANFILFRTPANQAIRVFENIKQHGVLIKNLAHAGGLLQDCLRVTIGTAEENAQFLDALKHSL